ncbi:MAG TPA: SusC/RagA family TonB-linked outer membrane protein [Dysgonomonas sp.]|nr:SusC/RagA family TonB-linked outer membrane protein [Dysgonomonas sp.]
MAIKKNFFCLLVAASFLMSGAAYASDKPGAPEIKDVQQQRQITGIVKDSNGEPLAGVSIRIKGTTTGTMTGIDGDYSINVPNAQAVLTFSFLGYTTQEITVGNQAQIDVTLADDAVAIGEVVVTALGIKREKKALGYSVSSVSGDDLTKAGTPLNAMSSLYGKAAGLQIGSTAGGPTGGMNIKIRNAVSLNESSSTRPLMVVDGIPIKDDNTDSNQRALKGGGDRGTGINDINADDIESIEILKGAKAAVLYGSEGANGVLLITTKSGRSKRGLGIDFSANYAVVKAAYGPEYQNEYGTGNSPGTSQYQNLSKDGFYTNSEGKEIFWPSTYLNFGPRMDGRDIISWDGTVQQYRAYKDNYNDLYRTGGQTAVNLAISNSGDLGSFRVGYNFKDYQSIMLNASNYSHTFSFNGDLKANDFIKIKASTSFTQNRDKNAPYRIQDITTKGLGRDVDINRMKDLYLDETGHNYFAETSRASNFPMGAYVSEYLWSQNQNENDYKRNHLIQSLSMDVKFNDNLSWVSLGGLDYTIIDNEIKGRFTRPISENRLQGYYGLKSHRFAVYYAQSTFNFDYDIASKWNLSGFVGGAVKRNVMEKQETYIQEEFAVENYFSFTNTSNPNGARSDRERGKDLLLSAFASAQLAYNDQVYLEVQGRNDWSSILPSENNSYFYPGVSLSWILSETLRNDLPNVIQFAKLRTSWADVGRPGPRYYGNVSFKMENYGGFPTLQMPDYLPPADFQEGGKGFPKPSLKPERKREFEVGLEASFFPQNRLSLDFSWYTSNTYNQIVTLPVPKSSGVKEVRLNAGDIGATGLELAINSKPIITRDFQWTLGVNFANYTNKINELDKGIDEQILWGGTGVNITAPEGGKYGEIWVRPYAVDDKSGKRLVDGNGTWYLDKTKWKKIGKITPDVVGGVNTSLSYKGFTLSANFDFQFGATLISQTNMYLLGNGTGKNSLKYRDEANGGLPYYMKTDGTLHQLSSHGDAVPADSHYPFIMHDGIVVDGVNVDGTPNTKIIPAQNYYTSTFWKSDMELSEDMVYKSDYFALRQISLSYDIPKAFLSKAKIQAARLSVFANNVAYIYKDVPNTTPESNLGTNNFTQTSINPGTRTFGVGINVSF